MLLCAGRGARLDPLTRDRPKCLVAVGGRAIIDHQLAALAAAGIDEVAVVAGYRAGDVAAHLSAAGRGLGVTLILNPFWAVSSSIGSVWLARHLLDGPFAIVNGDTVFDAATIRYALAAMAPGVNLLVEEVTAPADDDMRVLADGERVVAVGKRLPAGIASLRSLGIVLCPDADGGGYRAALDETIAAENGAGRFHHDVVDHLALAGRVRAIRMRDALWQEIDHAEDIARYERRIERVP